MKRVVFRINDDPNNTYEYRFNTKEPFSGLRETLKQDLIVSLSSLVHADCYFYRKTSKSHPKTRSIAS